MGAIARVEFGQNRPHVPLHRLIVNAQLPRYSLIGKAAGNQFEYFGFSWSQRGATDVVRERSGDVRVHPSCASIHEPNGFQELPSYLTFKNVRLRSGFQRSARENISGERRQHDNPRRGRIGADSINCVNTAHVRHLKIHEGDVGSVSFELLERFAPVARLRDEFQIRLISNQGGKTVPQNGVVIDGKHPYRGRSYIHVFAAMTALRCSCIDA